MQLGAVLRARDGVGLPAASNLVLNGGTLEYLDTGSMNRAPGSGAGQIRVLGTSGFAAWGGTFSVQLGAGPVVWGSADFNPSTLQFGFSPNANGLVDFQTGIDLNGGTRFVSYWDRSASTGDSALISGVISNSTGTPILVVGGNGTVELSGANTYNGQTVVSDSASLPGTVLRLVGSGSFANSPTVTVGAGRSLDVTGLTGGANYSTAAGRFQVAAGQTLAGSGTVAGGVLVGPGATIRGGSPADVLNDPTGRLTVNGPLRLRGGTAGLATLAVDLNGASASGATVSRLAVAGAGNAWDIDTSGGRLVVRLLNDQNLTANQSYTYVIGSAAGGFTRNGASVTSYTPGTDFDLVSSTFPGFTDVSLTVDGSNNLVLDFTPVPVPEPAAVLAVAAAGLAAARLRRRAAGRLS